MKKLLIPFYLTLCTTVCFAQVPKLTKDINKAYFTSDPANYYAAANVLYFAANGNNNTGAELWKSDGTAAGTSMVADIYAGTNSSDPANFCLVGNTVFFTAIKDGFANRELWKTDGTAAGTVLVKEICPGSSGSDIDQLFNYNGVLLFTATNGTSGSELWRSDGTAAGTYMVKEICPGTSGAFIEYFTRFGDSVYFRATDGVNGMEVWFTDGTPAGTQLFKNIYPGSQGCNPFNFVVFQSKLFFLAEDSATRGRKLWYTDGTPSGTVMYKNQSGSTASNNLTEHNGRLYYSGYYNSDQELLYTDGVNDIQYFNINQFGSSVPADLRSVGSKLFFTASVNNGRELYVSDGTSSGTKLTIDLFPIQTNAFINNMVVLDSVLYFTAHEDYYNNIELYSASGKVGGLSLPIRVKDILPGAKSSNPGYLTPFQHKLFLSANDDVYGNEIWVVDSGKAKLFKDVALGTQGSGITSIAAVNNKVVFNATTAAYGDELWTSRGDTGSTQLVKDLDFTSGNSTPRHLYSVGSKVLFTSITYTSSSTSYGSFQSTDGTNQGTGYVGSVPGSDPQVREYTPYDNKVYFVANAYSVSPGGLFVYNKAGNSVGTFGNINPSGLGDNVKDLTVFKGKLFFSATDGNTSGNELFYLNGSSSGIQLFADIRAGSIGSSPKSLEAMDSLMFFCANDGLKGAELWVTDGTSANTKLLKDVYLGSTGSGVDNITAYGHRIYFSASTAFQGNELWRSDGTDTGTVMVMDINAGGVSGNPRNFLVVNNLLYFTATTAGSGEELWVTDGTTAGTKMIKDIRPGSVGAGITELKAVGGTLYFTANDGVNGLELWQTDGSDSGTRMLSEIIAGSESSNPKLLTAVGDTLYFTADHPMYGNELWYVFTKCMRGSFTGKSTCVGDTISFMDQSDALGKTITHYTWSFGNGDTSNIQHPKYRFDSAGTYNVSLTVTNSEGCSVKTTQLITIADIPTAEFTLEQDSLCLTGNLYKFTNLSSPSSGPFVWSFGDNSTSTATSPTHNYKAAGSYTVTLNVGATIPCKASFNKILLVKPTPVIASITGPLTGKNDSTATYEVILNSGSSYSWTITGGVVTEGNGTNIIKVKWNSTGFIGTVKVKETNSSGCESAVKGVNVDLLSTGLHEAVLNNQLLVYPSPTTGLFTLRNLGVLDETTTVTVIDLLGKTIYTGEWNTGQSNLMTVDLTGNALGVYFVRVTSGEKNALLKIVLSK